MSAENVMISICMVGVAFLVRFFVALCAEAPKKRHEIREVNIWTRDLREDDDSLNRERWIESPQEFELTNRRVGRN